MVVHNVGSKRMEKKAGPKDSSTNTNRYRRVTCSARVGGTLTASFASAEAGGESSDR